MSDATPTKRRRSSPLEVAGIIALSIGALYVGQGIFIPVVLATLVAFALNPIVERLRRLGVPQLAAVLVTVLVVTGLALLAGYVMLTQLLKLAIDLPQYQQIVTTKLQGLQGSGLEGPFGRLTSLIEDLGKQLSPGTPITQPAPIPVTIADRPASPLEGLTGVFGSILGPLATGTLVFIFSIFLLLERVELRDRFLKLVSLGDLRTSTKVMDESAGRVSRYLLVQLVVNCVFGVVFGAGMFLLGVPNAILWGLLAIVFRYIPFIGTFAAVLFPAAIAFAVDPGWTMLLGVIGIYLALELLTTNAIEPNLYGTSTGLSPMAVLIAAIFWATLWGLVGLVLATPLTVCLVVLGRYVPRLQFLNTLLGSEPVLLPEERFYQRLLAGNVAEAVELTEAELKDRDATEYFDRVAIPALRLAEADLERDASDLSRRRNVVEGVNEVVDELDADLLTGAQVRGPVTIIGGKTELDAAGGTMLAHSLKAVGIEVHVAPPTSLTKDGLAQIDLTRSRVVLLCYMDPHPEPYARYASGRLLRKKNDLAIVACLFGAGSQLDKIDVETLRVDVAVRTISAAVQETDRLLRTRADCEDSDTQLTPAEAELELLRRFAPQKERFAEAGRHLAEAFGVPLAIAQLKAFGKSEVVSSQTLMERVIRAGEPVILTNVSVDKDASDDPFLVENGFHSFLGVPLKVPSGEIVGTIMLYDSVERDFATDLGEVIREAVLLVADLEARSQRAGATT
jgi:predicted PurR-regulated permease PerM